MIVDAYWFLAEIHEKYVRDFGINIVKLKTVFTYLPSQDKLAAWHFHGCSKKNRVAEHSLMDYCVYVFYPVFIKNCNGRGCFNRDYVGGRKDE